MSKKHKARLQKVTAQAAAATRTNMQDWILQKVHDLKGVLSWKIDPGMGAICAAIVMVSVPALPNIQTLWADEHTARIEAEISIRENNYAEINSELDAQRREVESWEKTLNADPQPEPSKQNQREAIRKYYESNLKEKIVLEKNHAVYKQAVRTNDPIRAAQSVNQIHASQFAEANEYATAKRIVFGAGIPCGRSQASGSEAKRGERLYHMSCGGSLVGIEIVGRLFSKGWSNKSQGDPKPEENVLETTAAVGIGGEQYRPNELWSGLREGLAPR